MKYRNRNRWFILVALALTLLPLFNLAASGVEDKEILKLISEAYKFLATGDYDKSISLCDQAIVRDPKCVSAYYTRGFAYKYKGDYGQAISDYNQAIEIYPRYGAAYYARAKAYFQKGEYDKSWEDVYTAVGLGCETEPEFLKQLRQASGRNE